ncbi:MAG: hypothetical protein AAGJ81_02000 [Verrucomicrobiota bacterium]
MKTPASLSRFPRSRSGFALIISLALVAFAVLLIVSLSAFVRVEAQSSLTEVKNLQARQNALLSLRIAMSELQSMMGPDQRVSARAELINNSNNTRTNRIGVWSAAPDGPIYNQGDIIGWLASDARNTGGLITNYNQGSLPGNAVSVELLGDGSLPMAGGTLVDPNDAVVIDMQNTTIELGGDEVGRYAWWVDDEGVKARVNLERETPTEDDEDYRAVLESMAFSEGNPSQLPAFTNEATTLEDIGFDGFNDRLIEFTDTKTQLTGTQADSFNTYFGDLTTWSSGVQANVRDGGLKRDLSLAFEMSDIDFSQSRFGQQGRHSYDVDGFGFVQPVFALTQAGDVIDGTSDFDPGVGVFAHGPLWSLLRQYYRIYREIANPLTDPVFSSQVFGPNVRHGTYPITTSNINRQPAMQYSGGQSDMSGSSNTLEPAGALVRMRIQVANSTIDEDQLGDPYRANIGRENNLSPMATANYVPYMIRMAHEFGVTFLENNVVNGLQHYETASRARSTFVIHNPYNVKLEHPEMNIDFEGPQFSVSAYNTITGDVVEAVDGDGAPHEFYTDDWLNIPTRPLHSQARIRTNTGDPMEPGEIKSFRGVTGDSSAFAQELANITDWTGFQVDRGSGNETFGPMLPVPAGGVRTFVGRVQNFRNVKTVFINNNEDDNRDPKTRYYSQLELNVNTFFDDGNVGGYDTEMDTQWPMTHSMTTMVAGINSGYEDVLRLGQFNRSKLESAYPDPEEENAFTRGPNYPITTIPFSFGQNASPSAFNTLNGPLPLVAIDFQLKPVEFDPFLEGSGGRNPVYPAFVLTNPNAPVKDNKNLLPADDIRGEGIGFGAFSPGWSVTLAQAQGTGPDLRSWGPTDGSLQNGSSSLTNIQPVMLELPTAPVLSLGKLQFANVTIYDHMPALAISNSFATPYVPLTEKFEMYENRYGNDRIFMDMSYLMNEALWDGYFFSSLSLPYRPDEYSGAVQDTFDAAFNTSDPETLPNPRVELELGDGESVSSVITKLFSSRDPSSEGYLRAAENLMVRGAFNINSTSVDAWKTLLAGARDQAVLTSGGGLETPSSSGQTPFSRFSQAVASETAGTDFISQNDWGGFRSLSDGQIEDLATAIVEQIRERVNSNGHPFLSLSSFVNRSLSDDEFGRRGVLQAAIDEAGLNSNLHSGLIDVDTADLNTDFINFGSNADNLLLPDDSNPSAASTVPNYLLQGDILQAIGSYVSARSDTFRIRSYGEAVDPVSGQVSGKAWVEAIVQRVPEPVVPRAGTSALADHEYWSALEANGDSTPFGRKFSIVSFRWLDEDDV